MMSDNLPELDFEPCKKHGVQVFGLPRKKPLSKGAYLVMLCHLSDDLLRCILWSSFRKIGLTVNRLLSKDVLRQYTTSDIVIDLSGDTLSDHGSYSIFCLLRILVPLLLDKPVIVYSQSIGPFSKINAPIARFCLDNVRLIVVRETETISILKDIGVCNPNIQLAADVAFLLKPEHSTRVDEILLKEGVNKANGYPLIGLGTSSLIYKILGDGNESYLKFMASLADYLVENMNAQVLLISHVIVPSQYDYKDDRYIAQKIYQIVKHKDRIKPIEDDYSPEELKGLIGNCELFIGTRMHSVIAAVSMLVPTVTLGWSHKYHGIMSMICQDELCCDIRTTNFNEVVLKITYAWNRREEIKQSLSFKIPEMEKSALLGNTLIKNLIEQILSQKQI